MDQDLLRFTTAGSVDDGKSTLIGRLLFEAGALYEDHLATLHGDSRKFQREGLDLSFVTDGLRAEREQGITIDVAYRYFSTPKRHSETTISPISKIKCFFAVIESGVFGLGLPQLLEFFVRGDYKLFSQRVGVIFKRFFFCVGLLYRTKTFKASVGRDKILSSEAFLRFFKEQDVYPARRG